MIEYSKEYDKFKPFFLNRPIQSRNLKNLISSVKAENLLSFHPLIITHDDEVLDGQHRLEAAKTLNLEFSFIRLPKMSLEQLINILINFNFNMSKWGNYHFALLYEKLNKQEYIKFKNFRDKYKVDITFALPICTVKSKRRTLNEVFRKGDFVFEHENIIYKLMDYANEFLSKAKELNIIVAKKPFLNTPFFDAYLKLMQHENFNQTLLISQLKKYKCSLQTYAKMSQYHEYLNSLLNQKRPISKDVEDIELKIA